MNDDNDEMTKLDPTREAQTLRGVYEAHENIEDNLLKEIQRVASSVWPEKRERDTLGLTELLCQQRKNHHRPEFLAASILHQRVGVVVVDGLEKLPHLETDKRFKKEKKNYREF